MRAGAAVALCSRFRERPRSQVAEAGSLTERLASILMKQPLGSWALSRLGRCKQLTAGPPRFGFSMRESISRTASLPA